MRAGVLAILSIAAILAGCAGDPVGREGSPGKAPIGHERYQRYWDGVKEPDYGGGATCTPEMRAGLAADYAGANRPEMMAFGDSLYNGVQSLRINWWLSEWSSPSLIAIRLGLIEERAADRTGVRKFYGPQYPGSGSGPAETIDYGFNLERLPHGFAIVRLFKLADLVKSQDKLLGGLTHDYTPPNGRAFVDNISFSGANSTDIDGWTPGEFRRQADIARHEMSSGLLPDFGKLGDAFTFANAAFVLNPTRNPCVEEMTPLQQILFRKPKRLFINLGANNGIFRAAFAGTAVSEPSCDRPNREPHDSAGRMRCAGTIREFLTERLIADLQQMGERLIADPGVEVVYINGIARPSRPANVVIERTAAGPSYHTDLFTRVDIPAAQMDAADAAADLANARVRALMDRLNAERAARGQGPRFVFVDMDAAFAAKDYKRCLAEASPAECDRQGRRLLIDHKRWNLPKDKSQWIDNRPMRAQGTDGLTVGKDFDPKVREGGVFSFDNMHLSSMGYELMAEAVRLSIDKDDPGLERSPQPCPDKVDPGQVVAIGACRRFMVEPGWSYADDTRRVFIFQRLAGDEAMHDKAFLKAMAAFAKAR